MSCEVYFMFEDDYGWVNLSLGDKQFIGECSYVRDTLSDLAEVLVRLKEGSSREYLLAIYEPAADLIELDAQGENIRVSVYRFGSSQEISWATNYLNQYADIINDKVPDSQFTLNLKSTINGFFKSYEKMEPNKYYEQWGHTWPSSLLAKLSA